MDANEQLRLGELAKQMKSTIASSARDFGAREGVDRLELDLNSTLRQLERRPLRDPTIRELLKGVEETLSTMPQLPMVQDWRSQIKALTPA